MIGVLGIVVIAALLSGAVACIPTIAFLRIFEAGREFTRSAGSTNQNLNVVNNWERAVIFCLICLIYDLAYFLIAKATHTADIGVAVLLLACLFGYGPAVFVSAGLGGQGIALKARGLFRVLVWICSAAHATIGMFALLMLAKT